MPARRLDRGAVDLADADEGVGQDRRDAEHGEGDRQVERADADRRRHEGDQRQLGDRPAGVAEADREQLADPLVPEVEAERQRHDQREGEGEDGHFELGQGQFERLVEAADQIAAGHVRGLGLEDEFERALDRAEREWGGARRSRPRHPFPGGGEPLDREQDQRRR